MSQLDFTATLGLAGIPQPEAESPPAGPFVRQGLLGAADVKRMQAEGWSFADGGMRMADCWTCWCERGQERTIVLLADPEEYPHLWPDEPHTSPTP